MWWRGDNSNSNSDSSNNGDDYRESPRSARVPRLAALLASLRCLSRRGSPSAPAPFSPTHCRPRPLQRPLKDRVRVPRTRTGTTRTHHTAHRRFLVPRGRSLSLALAGPARTRDARTESRAGPSGPWRAAGRESSSASPPVFQCRGRHCQPDGFAELRRSGAARVLAQRAIHRTRHPTQSSSLLLGARPDPHPVVGVRIGPVTTRSLRTTLARVRVPLRRSRTCAPP